MDSLMHRNEIDRKKRLGEKFSCRSGAADGRFHPFHFRTNADSGAGAGSVPELPPMIKASGTKTFFLQRGSSSEKWKISKGV